MSNDPQYKLPHTHRYFCGNCSCEINLILPVEPAVDFDLVPQLIPCNITTLYRYIKKLGIPKLYRYVNNPNGSRPIRILLASHVREIRERFIYTKGKNGRIISLTEYRKQQEESGQEEAGEKNLPLISE